jgi:hypothetical protein
VKRLGAFGGAMLVLIGGTAWIGALWCTPRYGNDGVRAIVTSAAVAFSVQLLTFGIASALAPTNVIAGWVGGSLVRFLVLAVHGFFGAPMLGLPLDVSLLSLASFFFLTMLIEPFFLARAVPGTSHGNSHSTPRTTS